MPFVTVCCRTFTVYCNKHNQHFTLPRNTSLSCCSIYSLSTILFAASLCTFSISLLRLLSYLLHGAKSFLRSWPVTIKFIDFLSLFILLLAPHLHTIYHSSLIYHFLFIFPIHDFKIGWGWGEKFTRHF